MPSPVTGGPSGAPTSTTPPTPKSAQRAAEREHRRAVTERCLTRAAQAESDQERAASLREVVVANMGVARALASRHQGRGIPTDDLEQVAYVALVRAAGQFDVGRNEDFLTYAVPCIKGELRRHFRDQGWMIRPPRRVQEVQSLVVRTRDELAGDHGDNVPMQAIADRLELDVALVRQALEAEGCFRPVSLDAPLTPSASSHPTDVATDDLAEHETIESRETLRPALRHLEERERRIVLLRFVHNRTQQQIADELGITQTQVSRLLSRLLVRLRELLADPDVARGPVAA